MHPEWKHLTSSDLNLDEDECLCMLIKLSNVLRGPLDKWQSTLNGNEIAAADRFRNSHDRNRYIASRYLLTSFLELVFKKKPLIFLCSSWEIVRGVFFFSKRKEKKTARAISVHMAS